jgi:hypothetical protein
MSTGGVLERHPKLRCAFLEGTAGWLYWWLWRLDDQCEKFGPGCERQISMMPSEYFKRQCYIARRRRGAGRRCRQQAGCGIFCRFERLPAFGRRIPEAIEQFVSLSLSDEQRRQILWDNCARLYAIERPVRPLSAEPRASAAQ